MAIAPNEQLESDLIDVINRHIRENKLHPNEAAVTMNKMTLDMLGHLSWHPQDIQCACIYLNEAQSWLQHGMGRAVLSHTDSGGDQDVLRSLIKDVSGTADSESIKKSD